jgi:RecA/RadA recombinase
MSIESEDKYALRMEALLSLCDSSIIQIDSRKAVKRINSACELRIDVTFPPELWELMCKGKSYDWKKGLGVPPEIIEICNILEDNYLNACDSLTFKNVETAADIPQEPKEEPEGNDEVSPEKLAELQNELADDLKKPEESETPEDNEKAKKQAEIEEKNRIAREENERRLEMAEQVKQQDEEARSKLESKAAHQKPKQGDLYTQPEDGEEDVPAPKKGEVKLLDILYDLVDDDLLQIYGKTGTGKTTIAMKAALEAKEQKKSVIYVDTEKNSSKKQRDYLKKVGIVYDFIRKPERSNETQLDKLQDYLKRLPKHDLVIIDSLGLPALSTYVNAPNQQVQGQTFKKMIAISDCLKTYANNNESLVIVINQPESDMNKDQNVERRSFGDKSEYYYKEMLVTKFAKSGRSESKTTIVVKTYRSRSHGMGTKLFTVEITDNGIKVIQ